jgi:hypothetical protein
MNIDELTIKEVKHIQSLLKGGDSKAESPYKIGKAYFIRTVTHYYTGRIERVTAKEIILSDAAWIVDSGRFHDALKTGKLNEVEPFTDEVIVGRGGIIDAVAVGVGVAVAVAVGVK